MTPKEQEAFARGRLQGLREMDEAHASFWGKEIGQGVPFESMKLTKLRQEYQQPN